MGGVGGRKGRHILLHDASVRNHIGEEPGSHERSENR